MNRIAWMRKKKAVRVSYPYLDFEIEWSPADYCPDSTIETNPDRSGGDVLVVLKYSMLCVSHLICGCWLRRNCADISLSGWAHTPRNRHWTLFKPKSRISWQPWNDHGRSTKLTFKKYEFPSNCLLRPPRRSISAVPLNWGQGLWGPSCRSLSSYSQIMISWMFQSQHVAIPIWVPAFNALTAISSAESRLTRKEGGFRNMYLIQDDELLLENW